MYYTDTISDPNYLEPRDYQQHHQHFEGMGDPVLPEVQFENGAEATIAAFLLEALTSGNNPIAREITNKLGSMGFTATEDAATTEDPLHLHDMEAVQVRRTVKEVAEADPQIQFQLATIPISVIRAAKQMHYGPGAREIGSTKPTPIIPGYLDLSKKSEDLITAIIDIAQIRAASVPTDHGAPHSAEFAADHKLELIDSIEHPIAA